MITYTKDGITKVTANVQKNQWGGLEPRLRWEGIEALGLRGAHALNLRIAALVQELSGDGKWGVYLGDVVWGTYTRNDAWVGSVYIETDKNTEEQAAQALAVLEKAIEVIKTGSVRRV